VRHARSSAANHQELLVNEPADRLPDMSDQSPKRSTGKIIGIVVAALVAVVALAYGAIFFYANVINDSPDELDEGDLAAALDATTTVADSTAPAASTIVVAPVESAPSDTASGATTPATTESDGGAVAGFDGDWVPTTASEFGYRVEEVLAGVNTTAVGRSNEIAGGLTISGTTATAVDIVVQVASITSDESRRDGQFTGSIMNSAEFPEATFTLTQPIDFGTIPADGETVTASATGDLTLRGVTNSVTFDLTASTTGTQIGVLGNIPIVFADYGIDNPSFGTIKVEDNGLVEFVLVFERA
jgi:polyisoprenoid-binding protein YceI